MPHAGLNNFQSPLTLDLESLCSQFEIANYDPVEYAGLIVRLDGSVTATLFASGTIMFTGVKSEEQMREFVSIVWEKIRTLSTGANIVGTEQN
ncbi:MAG: hypothetical protein E4H14_15920 [Candidatus Thorarchaeota archaeon]|nr:MAG: hypothetical protein E4H14_15920 [Candidatus Thorarchaeota archaeon]